MHIFNYFKELKKDFNLSDNIFNSYNIVNFGGSFIYIEGHKGIVKLSEDVIILKTNKGNISLKGSQMYLKDLSKNTVIVQGKIYKTEVF